MKWVIEYFEQEDTAQPAEIFEDFLDGAYPKLAGKLLYVTEQLQSHGHQMGGGFIEKCHDYKGLWEIRIIYAGMLAREFFGFDKERIVLLHGYMKRTGQPASAPDLKKAFSYWTEYLYTRGISPVLEEENE